MYSRILAMVCAVAMTMGLAFAYLKNPVIRLFSTLAHYELTCSVNTVLALFAVNPFLYY